VDYRRGFTVAILDGKALRYPLATPHSSRLRRKYLTNDTQYI